jgi:hypothetical protein
MTSRRQRVAEQKGVERKARGQEELQRALGDCSASGGGSVGLRVAERRKRYIIYHLLGLPLA